MSDETTAAAAAEPTAPASKKDEPSKIDVIVDRWFGDYAIPNHFGAAAAELKRRLNQAG